MKNLLLFISSFTGAILAQCDACSTGCTLTQGYWKTHWPQAWNALGDSWKDATICGVDACTCNIPLTTIFANAPKQGNDWLILAHQYAAALLNVKSGSCAPSCISSALTDAKNILLSSCVVQEGEVVPYLKSDVANTLASLLDSYNNGIVGPGHCGSQPPVCVTCASGECGCTYTQGAWDQKFAQDGNANGKGLCQWPGIPAESCLDWSWLELSSPTEETLLCGKTWWGILESSASVKGGGSNYWTILIHQWIASVLNVMNGACENCPDDRDYCAKIWEELKYVYDTFSVQCSISQTEWNVDLVDKFAETLEGIKNDFDDFNNGIVGPGHCSDSDSTANMCDSVSSTGSTSCPGCSRNKLTDAQLASLSQRLGISCQTSNSGKKFVLFA